MKVDSTYKQQLDNPASTELGLAGNTISDTAFPTTGIVSADINANTFTNWNSSTPASFQVSLNGSSYVTVTVNKSDLLGSLTMAGLISALNTKFAATTIDLSVPGATVTATHYPE